MTILPIVDREMRTAARRPFTYRTRLIIALVGIVVGTVVFLANLGKAPGVLGAQCFNALALVLMAHCLLSGRLATADCLTEEKREGTLGLLFLTDLKGYDIVLGKLAATSLNGFYGLLAVFPVLAIPLLMGGVSSNQFWKTVLVLMVTFFFSLAIGMFSSAACRDTRKAVGVNFGLLFFFTLLLPGCAGVIAANSASNTLYRQLFFTSPLYPIFLSLYGSIVPAGFVPPAKEFWISLAIIHALTWLLLVFSAWIVPRTWQDKSVPPVRSRRARLRAFWHAWSYGSAKRQPAYRKRLLDMNAFYWLAARARLKPLHVWTALALIGVWWLWGRLKNGTIWLDMSTNVTMALMLNGLLKMWIGLEAGQRLAEAQQAGALELILSTPITLSDIIRGQFLALRRQFLGPVLLALVLQPILMAACDRFAPHSMPEVNAWWIAGMVMLPIDILTMALVAMECSLNSKNFNQAMIGTAARVLLFPWIVFGVVALVINLWCFLTNASAGLPPWPFYLHWWIGIGLATDLGFSFLALRQISKMREIAMRRYATPHSLRGERVAKKKVATVSVATISSATTSPAAQTASEPTPPRTPESRFKKRRFAYALVALVLVLSPIFYFANSKPKYPPPTLVPLSLSQGQPQCIASLNGAYFLLSDGSVWRWGQVGNTASSASVPEPVGTNADWKKIAAGYDGFWGLRKDGTLWHHIAADGGLHQLEGRDWADIFPQGYALKKDGTIWPWGNQRTPHQTNMVQAVEGTNWMAIHPVGGGFLGIKRDGTLWAWSNLFIFSSGYYRTLNLPEPTQVCRESNWVGFDEAWFPLVRNQAGEVWMPLQAAPSPDSAADPVCRLLITNAVTNRYALAFCGKMMEYQLRPDGTLWERTSSYPVGSASEDPAPGKWHRFGKRKDWISIWYGNATAFGLTSDGTIWTWGIDPTQSGASDFKTKLRILQLKLKLLMNRSAAPGISVSQINVPTFLTEPRPIMRFTGEADSNVDKSH